MYTKEKDVGLNWVQVASTAVLAGLVILCLAALFVSYSAAVIMVLWSWFVSPVFAVPDLTLIQAIGIGTLVQFMTADPTFRKSDDGSSTQLIYVIARPSIALVIGFIIHTIQVW